MCSSSGVWLGLDSGWSSHLLECLITEDDRSRLGRVQLTGDILSSNSKNDPEPSISRALDPCIEVSKTLVIEVVWG